MVVRLGKEHLVDLVVEVAALLRFLDPESLDRGTQALMRLQAEGQAVVAQVEQEVRIRLEVLVGQVDKELLLQSQEAQLPVLAEEVVERPPVESLQQEVVPVVPPRC